MRIIQGLTGQNLNEKSKPYLFPNNKDMRKKKNLIETDYGVYSERNLAQLIRRKMISREHADKTKYTRKIKHKNKGGEEN